MKQKKIKNMTINELNTYSSECLQSLKTQHKLVEYWKDKDYPIQHMFDLSESKRNQIHQQKLAAMQSVSDLQDILQEIQKYQAQHIETLKNQAECSEKKPNDHLGVLA